VSYLALARKIIAENGLEAQEVPPPTEVCTPGCRKYRVGVRSRRDVGVPVEIVPGVRVVDVDLAIRTGLAILGTAAESLGGLEAGDTRGERILREHIDEMVQLLAACGVTVVVEPIQ
jgi:hypothetical protein